MAHPLENGKGISVKNTLRNILVVGAACFPFQTAEYSGQVCISVASTDSFGQVDTNTIFDAASLENSDFGLQIEVTIPGFPIAEQQPSETPTNYSIPVAAIPETPQLGSPIEALKPRKKGLIFNRMTPKKRSV